MPSELVDYVFVTQSVQKKRESLSKPCDFGRLGGWILYRGKHCDIRAKADE
jgi:hypothetical protein